MPCHAAMISKYTKFSSDLAVEKALAKLKKDKSEYGLVLNDQGQLEGLFSYESLFLNVLPVTLGNGTRLTAVPGVAKRLRKVMVLPVSEFMDRHVPHIAPEAPIWEGVKLLLESKGKPVIVVDPQSLKCLGVLTEGSSMNELLRMQENGEG